MAGEMGAEAGLLVMGLFIFVGSIILYVITGRPRLRFLLLLDLSLFFWLISYILNILTKGTEMTRIWQIISLMGMTLLLFSFTAAFVDYMKNGNS